MSFEPSKAAGRQIPLCQGYYRETIGNVTGAETWVRSGKEEHASGEAEIQAAKAKGYVEGGVDRLEGKKDSVVGAVTGDKQQQVSGNAQHDSGKTQQEFNKNF